MELTVGLTTVIFAIGFTTTALVGAFRSWLNMWDWGNAVPPWVFGAVVTFLAGTIGVSEYETTIIQHKVQDAKQAELKAIHDGLPEAWQLVSDFLDKEDNQATRMLIVQRFTTEGYGTLPAPDINFEQYDYFTRELGCRNMSDKECREWKHWVAQCTEPFAKFDLVAAVAANQGGHATDVHVTDISPSLAPTEIAFGGGKINEFLKSIAIAERDKLLAKVSQAIAERDKMQANLNMLVDIG